MSWPNQIEKSELEKYFIGKSFKTGSFFGLHADDYFFELKCEEHFLQAYNRCPPLKSIIGKRAKAFNSGELQILNTNTGNFATGMKSLKDKLKRPNVLQSGDQFFAQHNIYLDIFGYCPVLIIRPSGMEEEISSLWNLPPWLFDIDYTSKWLQQTRIEGIYKKYFMFWNGEKIELDMKNVHFVFDDGIGTECDTNLTIPDSRLISLEYPVSNIIACYKSRNTLITKRGAIGILSNEAKDGDAGSIPMKPGEKDSIQKDFAKYGLTGQPYQIIITDAQLKWQQMGFATKDLMLFEEIEDDINRLCDAYGYPAPLIARGKDTTFNNQKQARKDLIENTIIPEADSRNEQFSRILFGDESNYSITRDYSKLTVFQEDEKLKAESRLAVNNACEKEYKNGLITKNDWRERLGLDRLPDPEFDKYYNEKEKEGTVSGTPDENNEEEK